MNKSNIIAMSRHLNVDIISVNRLNIIHKIDFDTYVNNLFVKLGGKCFLLVINKPLLELIFTK